MKRVLRWLCISVPVLTGCAGVLLWTTVYESAAPSGGARLSVEITGCFADCAVRVMVRDGWSSTKVAHGNDCIVNFAHAAWSGTKVAVFVDGYYCGPIRAAVDVESGKPIDYETAKAWLAQSIIESYSVSPDELEAAGGDVFRWATYPGDGQQRRSMVEFRQRHVRK